MHPAAHDWVGWHAPPQPVVVIDIGGRDINGTIRHLFHPDSTWTSVDLEPGPAVDVVADFLDYHHPQPVDVVVCCEVAEHTPRWADIVVHAASQLRPGGQFIFTAAGHGRAPHSAHDGGPLQAGEWYENIDRDQLAEVLADCFSSAVIDVCGEDIRADARR